MQFRFNDQEVKDIVALYVKKTFPAIDKETLTVEGYIGEVRVEVKDPQKETN